MILFWIPGGMPLMLHVEGALARALQLRCQQVHAILCDGPFRACMRREVQDCGPISDWNTLCNSCITSTSQVLDTMEIPYSFLGDFVSQQTRDALWDKARNLAWDDLDEVKYNGIDLGKNIKSAVIRFLQGHDLDGYEAVVPEYAFSAYVCAEAAQHAFQHHAPTQIFMSHGIYVDWGPALQTAFHENIPVTAWMASYLHGRFYFRHVEDTIRLDFHNLSRLAWDESQQIEFSSTRQAHLTHYFENRYHRHISFDMKKFKHFSGDCQRLRHYYAPSDDKPVWGIMAHINWDCVSDYSPMAYSSFDEWIVDTIRVISTIQDAQWLIKIHPAESWCNPVSGVQQLIDHYAPDLPHHIRVISAEEDISPLDFFQMIDGGITVYGTAGLELLLQGKPVILAGEAHYGGKGFTYDGLTPESYRQLLRQAAKLPPLNPDQLLLAKKYAYCYFIQRQIPFLVVHKPGAEWWEYQPQKAHLLNPGQDPFTDFICERILDGQDFIMPENLVQLAEQVSAGERVLAEEAKAVDVPGKFQEMTALMEQASRAINANNLLLAYQCITQILSNYSPCLDAAVRDELQTSAAILKDRLESAEPPIFRSEEERQT